jgi:hypothetical protein
MTECIFGWGKQHGTMRKTKHRGIARCCCRFPAQLDRLQSDPHPQTGRGVTADRRDQSSIHRQKSTLT